MRILHEVHGLVTSYSPDIILQEERRTKLYTDFSPQEYECLKDALGLISVNKTLDLEKAMKVLQWFKQSTCPCNQHVIGRGGNQWQLRPATTVPTDVVLQRPTVSNATILKRRAAKQASLVVETSSIESDETFLQDEPVNKEPIPKTTDDNFNQKMKKMFQNPAILKEVKQANPLKWVNHVNSARSEVDELAYWKDQMKQDMLSHIQTKLCTGLDEMFGEMHNLFQEGKEEASQAAQDVTEVEEVD